MKTVTLGVAVLAAAGMALAAQAGSGCGYKKSASSCDPSACEGKEKTHAKSDHSYGTIDTTGLKSLVDSGQSVVLADARSGKYDDGKRIGEAVTLNADSSEEDIAAAIPGKDSLVVTYCSNLKCGASAKLADKLVSLGYRNVIKYPEGIQGWVDAGNTVADAKLASSAE